MSFTDPLGDMFTRIRNAQSIGKKSLIAPASKLRMHVLDVLKQEGYIRGYEKRNVREKIDELVIELKYHQEAPVITEIKRVSKPGRRVYSDIQSLEKFYNGLGIFVLSTSKGVVSDHEARKLNVGGEVLCKIF